MRSRIKLLLTSLPIFIALASEGRAQAEVGSVNFGNHRGCRVIHGQTGLPVDLADEIQAALYWAPLGATNFVQVGDPVAVGDPLPGIYAGGTRVVEQGTHAGALVQFQVRAWGPGADSYEEALTKPGMLVGESAIVQAATGKPGDSPPTPPASLTASGLRPFTLRATPLPPPFMRGPIRLRAGRIEFTVISVPGRQVEVLASFDLTSWFPVSSFVNISGTAFFSWPATNAHGCYYRLRQLP